MKFKWNAKLPKFLEKYYPSTLYYTVDLQGKEVVDDNYVVKVRRVTY